MEIKVAKTAGFCFGVSRAMELVEHLSKKGEKVSTLGPIIHNPQAVSDLESQGVTVVNSLSECENDRTVVIRSHGVPPQVLARASQLGLSVVDGTCPFVARAQHKAAEFISSGCELFILGDSAHPEVIGLQGYAGGRAHIPPAIIRR